MFHRIFAAAVLLALLTLTGCKGMDRTYDFSRKDFVYEKGGFPDEFGIRLYGDGSFTYYAGMYSSHVGYGNWSLDGDILTLSENPDTGGRANVFRFGIREDSISYIADGSDNFMYIGVSDGDKFISGELDGFPYQ